jgi:hypothetical protein
MSEKTPSFKDRVLVKTWSTETKLSELKRKALEGNKKWVEFLLEETDYVSYPAMLKRDWWTDGAPARSAQDRAKTGAKLVRYLLDSIPAKRLPEKVAKRIPSRKVDKDLVVLKIQADPNLKLKKP